MPHEIEEAYQEAEAYLTRAKKQRAEVEKARGFFKKGGDIMDKAKTKEIRISIPEELFSLFIPDKTLDHLIKAKKEMLLAFRSLIDAKIEALEKRETKKTENREKIKID